MWHLLRILFSKTYWRLLLRRDTWTASTVALRRMHKDKRARRQIARLSFLVLLPVAVLLSICAIGLAFTGHAGFVLIWGVVLGMSLLSRIGFGKAKQQNEASALQTLSLDASAEQEDHKTPELRRELAEKALLHAILADRAGSEQFLQTKELPENVEVITRRRHFEILREKEMYDRLGPIERDLLLLPDGEWPREIIPEVSLGLEPLRLLRWVLRVDAYLPTVGGTLAADYKLARSLVEAPELAFEGDRWISMEDLRTAIEAARVYLHRCWAEGVRRGFYTPEDESQTPELRAYALQLHGDEGKDLLLGAAIVSRAADEDVRLATMLSFRRAQVLEWIQRRLEGEEPPSSTVSLFYPPELRKAEVGA